jgi:MOSC domain-containing protein YiiM
MNLLDKLKGKNIARQWQWEKENNRATAARTINQRDYISEIEKIIENGKIKKNDFVNVVQPSHITTMIKKIHSLDEQNTYLQKYLKEMVNENEKITGELNDVQETLKAAKSSLAELTTEIQNMYAKQEEMDLN